MEEFLQRWDATLYYCWIEPPLELIHFCFYEQIKGFKELKRKIRYYDEDIEESHEDHTYEWLRKIVKQAIEKKRQKRNANERSASGLCFQGLGKGKGDKPFKKGKGKGKKGKGKGNGFDPEDQEDQATGLTAKRRGRPKTLSLIHI